MKNIAYIVVVFASIAFSVALACGLIWCTWTMVSGIASADFALWLKLPVVTLLTAFETLVLAFVVLAGLSEGGY